jgi:CRP-like cAMP-binding protein
MSIDSLRTAFLTRDLTDDQRAELWAAGEELDFPGDTELFVEGSATDHLWVLLDGRVRLTRQLAGDTVEVATMSNPGQWAGGLRAWADADAAAYRATGTTVGPTTVFRLPSADLARLVGTWFPFGKHLITGIYQTIRSIEATARQRESLVALGTMAAGLAHEINNPASASLRAVEALRATCDEMLQSLSALATMTISAEHFMALDGLRRDLLQRSIPEGDALAMMQREDDVGAWLERHRVERAWELAPELAAVGADAAWLTAVHAAVGDGALAAALRWALSTFTISCHLFRKSGLVKSVPRSVFVIENSPSGFSPTWHSAQCLRKNGTTMAV